jgi:hypothetical protein
MKLLFTTLKKTLFWSYERGSWQYDIMCVLILVFIFFAPNRFFQSTDAEMKRPYFVPGEQVGAGRPDQEAIRKYLLKAYGHDVDIARIETVTDSESGKTQYVVYEK